MRGPLPPAEFADQVGTSLDRIEEYRKFKLLDPDGDGLLDDFDVLRWALLGPFEEMGYAPDLLASELQTGQHQTLMRIFNLGREGYTLQDAAKRMGITLEQAEEICLALGHPTDSLLDRTDVEAFGEARQLMDLGIPWEGVVEGARVLTDALRRIAHAEINMTHRFLCERMAKEGVNEKDIMVAFYAAGPTLTDLSNKMIEHLHEDMLLLALAEHAVGHLEAGRSGGLPGALHTTILFVDLALFTPLAQAHGDEQAAEILDRFDALVRKSAVQHSGRLVKQIGDAFMLTFPDPADAVRFANDVLNTASQERNFPALRVGINSGPVLYRVGDYVGNTVNVASRVVAMAMPNVILMTEPVAKAARDAGIAVEELGVRRVRGAEEPLAIYRATTKEAPALDPVCGMVVGDSPAATIVHDGQEYAFCSHSCLKQFLDDPERYSAAS